MPTLYSCFVLKYSLKQFMKVTRKPQKYTFTRSKLTMDAFRPLRPRFLLNYAFTWKVVAPSLLSNIVDNFIPSHAWQICSFILIVVQWFFPPILHAVREWNRVSRLFSLSEANWSPDAKFQRPWVFVQNRRPTPAIKPIPAVRLRRNCTARLFFRRRIAGESRPRVLVS